MKVLQGDVIKVLRRQRAASFDACLTDPPYGLSFMGKQWDKGIPGSDVWAEVLRVLKPGAPILAFGGTRTFHRLTCAIEDAGFEIRDCLMWIYGVGFPKSLDIGKAIDKQAGAVREVIGFDESKFRPNQNKYLINDLAGGGGKFGPDNGATITAPATDAAKRWNGYGTALKPAWEPIILAMKPLDGTYAQNALKHGVAGLHIDAGRIPCESKNWTSVGRVSDTEAVYGSGDGRYADRARTADKDANSRWPANLILDERAAELLDEPSRFFYVAKASRRERGADNTHPTVKPITLAEYLARLILPPAGRARRLLVPFSGSGSELLGARRAGWEYALGIELSAEYAAISDRRLAA